MSRYGLSDIFQRGVRALFAPFGARKRLVLARLLAREAIQQWERNRDVRGALRHALEFHNELCASLRCLATRAEGGIHPKHRLIRYHKFFTDRIGPQDSVLDIGCNYGTLTRDLGRATRAAVVGVESERGVFQRARGLPSPPNVSYVCADATRWRPDRPFDVIVLSNVLEHIERRIPFLTAIIAAARPKKVLVRVPMRERDWIVPLKQELKVDNLLDPSHRIEYTEPELRAELQSAGLRIEELFVRFGEYLVTCIAIGEVREGLDQTS